MQSKRRSFLEGLVNVTLGFGVGWMGNRYVGLNHAVSLELTTILTIISFCRGYLVRRLFNWLDT